MRKFQVGALCKIVSRHNSINAVNIDMGKPVIILNGWRLGNIMRYTVSYAVLCKPFRCIGYVSCKDLKQVGHYKGDYSWTERERINNEC